jgi:hypothetical protein
LVASKNATIKYYDKINYISCIGILIAKQKYLERENNIYDTKYYSHCFMRWLGRGQKKRKGAL